MQRSIRRDAVAAYWRIVMLLAPPCCKRNCSESLAAVTTPPVRVVTLNWLSEVATEPTSVWPSFSPMYSGPGAVIDATAFQGIVTVPANSALSTRFFPSPMTMDPVSGSPFLSPTGSAQAALNEAVIRCHRKLAWMMRTCSAAQAHKFRWCASVLSAGQSETLVHRANSLNRQR